MNRKPLYNVHRYYLDLKFSNLMEGVGILVFTTRQIETAIYSGFAGKYRRFSKFVDSGNLWTLLLTTIRDAELMRNIKFCNDILMIPPVKVFITVHEASLGDLTNAESQSIGAFFGYLFKHVLGYTGQESVSCIINTIKTATRFYGDIDTKSIIIREESD